MNGYSPEVKRWSNEKLLLRYKEIHEVAKYSGPAQDTFWLYRAILEECRSRKIDPKKTKYTTNSVMIPCDSNGKPHRDQPERFIKRRR